MSLHDKAVEEAARVMCCRPHASGWVCPSTCEELRRHVLKAKPVHDAIMAAYAAAGWKLTSRVATEGMVEAGETKDRRAAPWSGYSTEYADGASHWSAMHDAAPSPEEAP